MKTKVRENESFIVSRVSVIALLFMIAFFAFPGAGTVKAASITNASSYMPGSTVNGVLTENGDDENYYKFTLNSSGSIQITMSAYMQRVDLYLFDENADELWKDSPSWNSTSEVITVNNTVFLTAGTYYFCVGKYYDYSYGEYRFTLDFDSSLETFSEYNGGSNNTLEQANVINTNGMKYRAQMALNDEKDFFRFTLSSSGKVNFSATFYKMKSIYWKLYDENGEELCTDNPWYNSTTENITVDDITYLTKGTYYLSISTYYDYSFGMYDFSILFTSSNESYTETNGGSNNTIAEASPLSLGKNYKGQIAWNDEKDFYGFNLSESRSIVIHVTGNMRSVYIKLYDADGDEICSRNPWSNSTSNKISFSEIFVLEQGEYYIAIQGYGDYCGDYSLRASKLTQKNCPHDYKSEWYSATYFKKGYRLYTCELCGHSYKGDYENVKKLGQVYLSMFATVGKKTIKVSWNSVYEASGYQIRYSKSRSLKSGVKVLKIKGQSKTFRTIGKLSRKKKYYIQVRAYKTSGSKTVYGKWSGKRCWKTR